MDFQVIGDLFNKPERWRLLIPIVPVLVERDFGCLSKISRGVHRWRFPHPQLMPVDPIIRARARQLLVGWG